MPSKPSSSSLRVECYAGYRGEETPRKLYLGERGVDVVEVLARWMDPENRYFKVKGSDGRTYTLCSTSHREGWILLETEPGG